MKIKKIASILLSAIMIFGILTTVTNAQSVEMDSNQSTEEYVLINGSLVPIDELSLYNEGTFEIKPSFLQRINSNGTFDFDVGYSVTSTSFKVSATQTTIKVKASIKGPTGNDVTSSYPDHRYQIIFYKKGSILDTKISSSYFYADKTEYSWAVVGLNTSDTYYFVINNTDYLPSGTTVSGSGSLTNYVHP